GLPRRNSEPPSVWWHGAGGRAFSPPLWRAHPLDLRYQPIAMIAVCGFRRVPWRTAEEEQSMNEMFAQGDLLIERVADVEPSGTVMAPDATGVCVLAEGELTGDRLAIYDRVTVCRD